MATTTKRPDGLDRVMGVGSDLPDPYEGVQMEESDAERADRVRAVCERLDALRGLIQRAAPDLDAVGRLAVDAVELIRRDVEALR